MRKTFVWVAVILLFLVTNAISFVSGSRVASDAWRDDIVKLGNLIAHINNGDQIDRSQNWPRGFPVPCNINNDNLTVYMGFALDTEVTVVTDEHKILDIKHGRQ